MFDRPLGLDTILDWVTRVVACGLAVKTRFKLSLFSNAVCDVTA
jgi:hypothetical protein